MLSCPKCQVQMTPVMSSDRKAVVDHCQKCDGYFLDRDEVFHFVADKSRLRAFVQQGLVGASRSPYPCPRCRGELFSGVFPETNFEAENCPRCGGLFFDRGELQQLISTGSRPMPPPRLRPKAGGPEFGRSTRPAASAREDLPPVLREVLDRDEEVQWIEKPHLIAYLSSGLLALLIFGIFAVSQGNLVARIGGVLPELRLYALAAFGLFLIGPYLVFRNTYYVLTDRRALITGGFFGIDVRSIDYGKITDLDATVSPLDRILGTGTVQLNTASSNQAMKLQGNSFRGVASPYLVLRLVKEHIGKTRASSPAPVAAAERV